VVNIGYISLLVFSGYRLTKQRFEFIRICASVRSVVVLWVSDTHRRK